jgi:hypothetical protein
MTNLHNIQRKIDPSLVGPIVTNPPQLQLHQIHQKFVSGEGNLAVKPSEVQMALNIINAANHSIKDLISNKNFSIQINDKTFTITANINSKNETTFNLLVRESSSNSFKHVTISGQIQNVHVKPDPTSKSSRANENNINKIIHEYLRFINIALKFNPYNELAMDKNQHNKSSSRPSAISA